MSTPARPTTSTLPFDGAVLVTGCSGGIGRATALHLVRAGLPVHATARRVEQLAELGAAGCTVGTLDVTDDASVRAAYDEAVARHGAVGAVVNNAGYGEYGAVEEVSVEAAARQLDTNVIGVHRLTRTALPAMRAAGRGRVVTVGSMGGRLTFPGGGWYHASKYALEALHDAMRVELRPFGVGVSLVEPGLIRTDFGATAARTLTGAAPAAGSAYGDLVAAVEAGMARSYDNRLMSAGPEPVARAVHHALTARRPRSRYLVTPAARGLVTWRRLAGDRAWDATVRSVFSLR